AALLRAGAACGACAYRRHHVALDDARRRGRAARHDVLHLGAVGGGVADRAGVDADLGVRHRAGADQLVGDVAGVLDGDGEAEADRAALALALTEAADGGVDTDDRAGRVDEGATGVAGVDRGVGLDRVDD